MAEMLICTIKRHICSVIIAIAIILLFPTDAMCVGWKADNVALYHGSIGSFMQKLNSILPESIRLESSTPLSSNDNDRATVTYYWTIPKITNGVADDKCRVLFVSKNDDSELFKIHIENRYGIHGEKSGLIYISVLASLGAEDDVIEQLIDKELACIKNVSKYEMRSISCNDRFKVFSDNLHRYIEVNFIMDNYDNREHIITATDVESNIMKPTE